MNNVELVSLNGTVMDIGLRRNSIPKELRDLVMVWCKSATLTAEPLPREHDFVWPEDESKVVRWLRREARHKEGEMLKRNAQAPEPVVELQTYQSPSELRITNRIKDIAEPTLSDLKRGALFLRNGAVCMRVDVGTFRDEELEKALSGGTNGSEPTYFIINLGTGRVFPAVDCPVQLVKAELIVE